MCMLKFPFFFFFFTYFSTRKFKKKKEPVKFEVVFLL